MRPIRVTPADADRQLLAVAAGDEIVFSAGHYRKPLKLNRVAATAERPVILRAEPGVMIGMDVAAEDFRREGNRKARSVEDAGKYPGL